MNKTNPFIPQGSLVEQMNKKRARVKMAVLAIFSGTILLISPVLLIQGCKRSDQSSSNDTMPQADNGADLSNNAATPTTAATPIDTNASNGAMTAMPVPAMAPTPTPAVAPAPSASTYVVVPHDTLGTIAKKFNVKLKDLEAANPDVVPTKLAVGKTLNIPASSSTATAMTGTADSSEDVYTVKPGDNLSKIAKSSGTTVKELMALNSLKSTRINAGEKLKLPAKTAATSTASPMETMPAATTTASNPTSGMPVMR